MWKLTLLCRFSILGVVAIGLFTGCSTLGSLGKAKVPTDSADMKRDVYLVEMYRGKREPTQYTGRLETSESNPTTVQTALEESGAIRKYRNMKINVYRKVAGKYGSLKMPVTYEPRRDAVSVEQDYALHNGDRIVVKPYSPNPFGKFFGALSVWEE